MSVLEVKDAPSSRPPTYGGGTGLWATKSISALRAEAEATGERSLNRTLGAMNLTMLGIGAIIGAGIFVLTGLAAALHAGPAVPISFIFAAVACGLAGLCYAEMASAVPVAGSAYTYSYATMGEFIAWIIGWDLVLEYAHQMPRLEN
jgi:APA family basic amino acid/polyamine antiporter